MSATPVSICSNALLMLGDNPIADFDEGTDKARLASNLWGFARDAVLRRHPWNCAIKRVTLAPDEAVPAFDYGHQFTLPSDWLRTLSVGQEGDRPRYKMEGGKLLMDETVCRLRYVWRNDNPATWDALLVETMTHVMRNLFAYPTTQSGSLEQLVNSTVQAAIREARAVDGSEDEPEAFDDSPLLRARYIGNGTASPYRGA
jgi:hypothetical protein